MIARENLVTLDLPEGYRVLSTLGRVTGAATRPHNMLRATFRSIGAFIGLAPIEYLTDAERAREDALDLLRSKASSLGADAVIRIRFDAIEDPDGTTNVVAYGDAVRLAPQSYGSERNFHENAEGPKAGGRAARSADTPASMSLHERARRERLLMSAASVAAACRKCQIGYERRNNVYGEGDPCARLMLVGEGPGETEDLLGRPFVGRAGESARENAAGNRSAARRRLHLQHRQVPAHTA